MLILGIKLLFAPAFIVATYLVQGRYGARLGGAFMAVPFIVFPVLIVLYLQYGSDFLTSAIIGTYAGQIAMLLFIAVYSRLSSGHRWWVCLSLATATFLAGAVLIEQLVTTIWTGMLAWLVVWAAVLTTYPRYDRTVHLPRAPRWDLLVRVAAALVMIFAVSSAAEHLGPRLSGALAMYPVMTSVMVGFNHQRFGPTSARALLHGLAQYLVVPALAFFPLAALLSQALPDR